MVVIVSLNPAVDKYLRLSRLQPGRHQQASEVITSAGGKGINVAGVLRTLDERVRLLGFFGGLAGEFLLRQMAAEGIDADAVHITSATRTAFVLVEDSGVETEIVEPGGAVSGAEIDDLRHRLRTTVQDADVVVLSGSVPPGCPADIYQDLLEDCRGNAAGRTRCPVIVDTSCEWLDSIVRRVRDGSPRPSILKPNRNEAEQLLGRTLHGPADVVDVLELLSQAGVETPVVSAGAAGLFVRWRGEVLRAASPQLRTVNSVGSGDAAVAGLAAGLARGLAFPEVLRLAAACGSANVLTKECAQVLPDDVERLLPQIAIAPLDGADTTGAWPS